MILTFSATSTRIKYLIIRSKFCATLLPTPEEILGAVIYSTQAYRHLAARARHCPVLFSDDVMK